MTAVSTPALFSPQSHYWRINREWLIALAGPRAVFLELAHPGVAAAVAAHSAYRTDPFGRLSRTMKTMTELSFGGTEDARAALMAFHRCHAHVHGDIAATGGRYDANDSHLKLWVWATLVDSVLRVYQRFVQPLTYADRCAYYRDAARLARHLGVPRTLLPVSYTAFNLYLGAMLYGPELQVTPAARDIVDALFAPPVLGGLTRAFSWVSVGLLPDPLRAAYGFTWDTTQERRLQQLAALSRRVRPLLPGLLAVHPRARSAESAARSHAGHSPRVSI